MALLNSGLKLTSSGSGAALGSITIATVADAAFPATTTVFNGTVRTNTGGAAIFTVNPLAPTTGATFGTIVSGAAATLYVEYNTNGQYRFDLVTGAGAKTSPTLVSQWYSVGTEHTVGVNYNAIASADNTAPANALITMAIDGKVAASQIVAFTSLAGGSGDGRSIGSFGTIGSSGNFNGYIDQYAVFQASANLSPAEFANYTLDPAAVASALTGHNETQAVAAASTPAGTIDNRDLFIEAHPAMIATGNAGSNLLTVGQNGGAALSETATATFTPLTLGQQITVDGRVVTATTGTVTAAEVATAMAGGAAPANGTATGALATFNGTASGATVSFTSQTATNVADLSTLISTSSSTVPTVVTTQGGAATETSVVTFNNMVAGQV